MAEFILWVLFAKKLAQVAILKKDWDYWKKNCNNGKRSRLWKRIVIIEKYHNYWKILR